MSTEAQNFIIRPIRKDEKRAVIRAVNRSLRLVERSFFSFSDDTYIAEQDGKLQGVIVLRTYPISDGRKGGLIEWVVTLPAARGKGIASQLVDAAVQKFETLGLDEISACIEGYNVRSSRLFSKYGFTLLSPGELIRRYGRALPRVLYHMSHTFDIGHFVWAKPGEPRTDHPALQWWGVWLLNSLLLLLAFWRTNRFGAVDPFSFAAIPGALLLLFGARWLAMKLAANLAGLQTRFRAWESGLFITFLIAILVGGQFPSPGSIYPPNYESSDRKLMGKLGRMGLAGILAILAIGWAVQLSLQFASLPLTVSSWFTYIRYVVVPLIILDVIAAAVFPFVSYNGRRVWDWSRPLWIVLALLSAGLVILSTLN
jgi:RimJ/RimL family protein N-acetyltransferase